MVKKIEFILKLLYSILLNLNLIFVNPKNLIEQAILVGPKTLGISIVTSGFIGIVFTFQVIKEFLYLDASSFIGAILSIAFIRELSPVLTAVIACSKVGSSFTAELAAMKVSEQIDALYLLQVDPFLYLIMPRLLSSIIMLPCLNIFFLLTSLSSGLFTAFMFYNVHPSIFLNSSVNALSFQDFIKSSFKSVIFGLIFSTVSCIYGVTVNGGSKNVGQVTTFSVVTSLLLIFILDSILTYILFNQTGSVLKFL